MSDNQSDYISELKYIAVNPNTISRIKKRILTFSELQNGALDRKKNNNNICIDKTNNIFKHNFDKNKRNRKEEFFICSKFRQLQIILDYQKCNIHKTPIGTYTRLFGGSNLLIGFYDNKQSNETLDEHVNMILNDKTFKQIIEKFRLPEYYLKRIVGGSFKNICSRELCLSTSTFDRILKISKTKSKRKHFYIEKYLARAIKHFLGHYFVKFDKIGFLKSIEGHLKKILTSDLTFPIRFLIITLLLLIITSLEENESYLITDPDLIIILTRHIFERPRLHFIKFGIKKKYKTDDDCDFRRMVNLFVDKYCDKFTNQGVALNDYHIPQLLDFFSFTINKILYHLELHKKFQQIDDNINKYKAINYASVFHCLFPKFLWVFNAYKSQYISNELKLDFKQITGRTINILFDKIKKTKFVCYDMPDYIKAAFIYTSEIILLIGENLFLKCGNTDYNEIIIKWSEIIFHIDKSTNGINQIEVGNIIAKRSYILKRYDLLINEFANK